MLGGVVGGTVHTGGIMSFDALDVVHFEHGNLREVSDVFLSDDLLSDSLLLGVSSVHYTRSC